MLYYILSILIVTVAGNSIEDVHSVTGSAIKITCPFYAQNNDLIWRGPPNLSPYSINAAINKQLSFHNKIEIQQTSQTGQYNLIIQNITKQEEGLYQCETLQDGIGLRHQFSVFVEDSFVDIWPSDISCNISSSIKLYCQIIKGIFNVTNHRWIQMYNGQLIRQLKGEVFNNISTLVLHFCDFRDSGTYTCTWSPQDKESFSSKATVSVLSQPLVASKRISNDDTFLTLQIVVYGQPPPTHAYWYSSSKLITEHQQRNETAMLNLSFYNKKAFVSGFIFSFEARYTTEHSIGVFNCQIVNSFGTTDVWFDQEYITQYFRKTIVKEYKFLTQGTYIVVGSLICSTVFTLLCATSLFLYKRTGICRGHTERQVYQQHSEGIVMHYVSGISAATSADGEHEYEEILDSEPRNTTDNIQVNQEESDTDTEQNPYIDMATVNSYEDLDFENKTIHIYAQGFNT